jgi:hypothetical protein
VFDLNDPWRVEQALADQSHRGIHFRHGRRWSPVTWTSFDRWTCPTCGVTEVADYPDLRTVRIAIRLAQEQHARDHAPQPPGECLADRAA